MTRMSLVVVTLCLAASDTVAASKREISRTLVTAGPYTIVVTEGESEPASVGSYSVLVYRDDPKLYGEFVAGKVAKRDGSIAKAWVATLSESEESHHVIVWCQSSGSGSYGSLDVYELNRKGQLRQIALPKMSEFIGYMGHDRFFLKGRTLYREFPIYQSGDPMSRPSGGLARYRLDWKLKRWVQPDKYDPSTLPKPKAD